MRFRDGLDDVEDLLTKARKQITRDAAEHEKTKVALKELQERGHPDDECGMCGLETCRGGLWIRVKTPRSGPIIFCETCTSVVVTGHRLKMN